MRNAKAPLPRGISDWHKRKMAQANTPRTPAQQRVLNAYSNYLLKDLLASAR